MSFTFDKTTITPDDMADCLLGGGGSYWYDGPPSMSQNTDEWGKGGIYSYCDEWEGSGGGWQCDRAEADVVLRPGSSKGTLSCSGQNIQCAPTYSSFDSKMKQGIKFCQINATKACAKQPCQNGGYCMYDQNFNGKCVCLPGWKGQTCETATCKEECKNGGTCSGTTCKCLKGWTGPSCSTKVCDPACGNGRVCKDGKCVCPPGYRPAPHTLERR